MVCGIQLNESSRRGVRCARGGSAGSHQNGSVKDKDIFDPQQPKYEDTDIL